ncbi:MAG: HDOD domain-containing protein [Pseudomonadota bacterium]
MTTAAHSSLDEWVRRISEEEMPIFGHTVQQVVSVAEDENAPTAALARVILQDASMTARVLKLANSVYYNPREQQISTISRAVVVLGFTTVRSMCLSIALVDSFVQGAPRDRLTRELARAIHAAVQARTVALERGDASPEEVFIAALLYHLGDLAFWCFSGEAGDRLDTLLRQPGITPEQAEMEVLGFPLRQLSASLVKEWRINDLLSTTLRHPDSPDVRSRNITLCHQLARAAEKGWESPRVQQLTQELARMTGQSDKAVSSSLHQNARDAARIAGYYGAAAAAAVIPLPRGETVVGEDELKVQEYPEPDGMLQLRILRELALLLDDPKSDFNLVLELVLEGIYRGAGMDRTLFALLTPDRRGLRAKFALGGERDALIGAFHFTRHPQEENAFFHLLDDPAPLWFEPAKRPEQRRWQTAQLAEAVGRAPFFAAPILVNGKAIGLFFCDRALSERPLDEESFESFKHFVQQAGLGLGHLSQRRR